MKDLFDREEFERSYALSGMVIVRKSDGHVLSKEEIESLTLL